MRISHITKAVAAVAAAATVLAAGVFAAFADTSTPAASTDSITLTPAQGNKLTGHQFSFYQIASYANPLPTPANGSVSSVTPVATDAQNKWVQAAIDAWNTEAAKPNSGKTAITVPAGQDAVTTFLKLQTTANGAQIRAIADSLANGNLPSVQSGNKVSDTADELQETLPAGVYLITDTKGNPIVLSTTINGATSLTANGTTTPLGSAVIKSTDNNDLMPTKKLTKLNDTAVADAQNKSAVVSVGDKAEFTIEVPLQNNTNTPITKAEVTDTPTGLKFVTGSASAKVGNTAIDNFAAPTVNADGSVTFDITSIATNAAYSGKKLTITLQMTITSTEATESSSVSYNDVKHTGDPSVVTLHSAEFKLKKVDFANADTALSGAQFTLQDGEGKFLSQAAATTKNPVGAWSRANTATAANTFTTASDGTIDFNGLGAGTYTLTETKAPEGYFFAKAPVITVTIGQDGAVTFADNDAFTNGLLSVAPAVAASGSTAATPAIATVKNTSSLTQLPATGAAWTVMLYSLIAVLVAGAGYSIYTAGKRLNRHEA